MSILYKVHNVRPSLQRDDQEDGHPGKTDIVKGDGTMERICRSRGALCVILKVVRIKWLYRKIRENYHLIPVHTASFVVSSFFHRESAFLNNYNMFVNNNTEH